MDDKLLKFNFMLVILSALSLFTPVFSGYVLGLCMIGVLIFSRFVPPVHDFSNIRGKFWGLLRPISKSSLIFVALLIVAGFWAAIDSEQLDAKAMRNGLGHVTVKYVILWFVCLSFWWRAAAFRNLWRAFTYSFTTAAIIHSIYCLAQRQMGLDWAHGFSGSLGSGRFAYGVYRISGFVGHPLTLGYCQALALVGSLALGLVATERGEKIAWMLASVSAGLVLIMSGSRGPILSALIGVGLIVPWKILVAHWKIVLTSFAVTIVLAFYVGFFARFLELFQKGIGGDERSLHWSVHWRAFCDHPFHGIGPGAPHQVISAYYLSHGVGDSIKLAHNAFLQFAADYGFLGLLGVVNWVVAWFVVSRKTTIVARGINSILAVSLIGSLSQNTYQDSEFIYALTVWTMLLVAREVGEFESSHVRAKNKDFVTREGGATT